MDVSRRELLMGAALSALAGSCAVEAGASPAAGLAIDDPIGVLGQTGAPVSCRVSLDERQVRAALEGRLSVRDKGRPGGVRAQFQPDAGSKTAGRIWWKLPPGPKGRREFRLVVVPKPLRGGVTASRDPGSGQIDIKAGDAPILRYVYQTIEPGSLVDRVAPADRIYARARSDYIHPLYGPGGEEMTKDFPIDHPHHRGIYWAWPEVGYAGDLGDLHALQKVFARPAGKVILRSGPVYAEVDAENEWRWEDREPIVRERAVIRAFTPAKDGRWIDLIFTFEALGKEVTLARRHTDLYGGLNVRLAKVADQQIRFHSELPQGKPRPAWADLSGTFEGASRPAGLTILQHPGNPDYPGDWVKYPELNWFQPTFPAAKTRYSLKPGSPLTLRYRLRIHTGAGLPVSAIEEQALAYRLAEQ